MRRFLRRKESWLLVGLALVLALWIGQPPERDWQRSTSWTPLLRAAYDAQAQPVFPDTLGTLDGQTLRLNGFMVTAEGEKTRRFLLSAYPPACPTCIPAGPESLVDVRVRQPVAYRRGSVSVQGTFRLARGKKASGAFYRLTAARIQPQARKSDS